MTTKHQCSEDIELPPLPRIHDQWTREMNAFAKEFNDILSARIDENRTIVTQDASIVLGLARVAQNPHLVTVYHQFLLHSSTPKSIKAAWLALSAVDPAATLTESHIAVSARIKEALADWDDRQAASMESDWEGSFEQTNRMIHELSTICFEDMSPERTDAVIMLIGRDITDPQDVRSSLEDFAGVHSVLLEGTL